MIFSRHNSSLTLEGLRTKPESQYLERKGRDTKAPKIANELIGMLNAGGGTLVFGLGNGGVVESLDGFSQTELDHYRRIAHDLIEPPANIEIEEIFLSDGSLIFVYHVDQDHERLFQRRDNEHVFLRVADSNKGPLNRSEVKKLEYNKAIRSYEDEVREDFDPRDLNLAVCETYRQAMNFGGSFEDLAIKRNLAARREEGVVFKNAAILLFAKDPSQYIPNASVRYVRYQGTELLSGSQFNVIKDQRFEEGVPSLIERLDAFMRASLRDYYFLNMDHGRFERVPEYPREAWLEGIVNALCHRSYNLHGNSIYIHHFDDRLEIANSGPLPAQVTVENIGQERYSRNPRIARVLAEMGFVRELNEGVPRIYSAMRQSMLAEPEYTDKENRVTLTLRNKVAGHKETIHADTLARIESNWENLNSSQREIVNQLFLASELTIQEMVELIGLSEQAIRYNLKKIESLEIVERISLKIRDPQAIYRFKNR